MRTGLSVVGVVVLAGACALASASASCAKPPAELAGAYVGAGTEHVTLTGGAENKTFHREPPDERVTVTRDKGRELHIKYGSCDLPSRANPDGLSATVVYGKCWVQGYPGPISVDGTFAVDPTGKALTVLVTGTMPAPAGTVAYSYKFAGQRAAP